MKMRIFTRATITSLLFYVGYLAVFPVRASAQGSTWVGESLARMVEGARWRLGDLRVNASFNLTNAGYDTDIYYGFLDEATADATFSASVPFQVLLPLGKKAVLELNESPQYLFFLETKRERAWNNIFGGRVHFALEKFYIQAGGGLSNVRRRLSPELDVNVREKVDSLEGTILWQASEKLSLAALYAFGKYDYGEPEFEGFDLAGNLNRNENYFDLVTYIEPSTRVRLFLDGQYGIFAFTEPSEIERDTRSYAVFAGLTFVPREDQAGPVEPPQGSLSLGYKRFDILDPALEDGSGIVGAVDVSTGLFEKTTIRAYISRDFAFSVYGDATFYLSTSFGGGINRRLSRKAAFSYDLSFGRSNYPEDMGSADERNYKFTNQMFALNVRLARYLAVTFQTSLSQRTIGSAEPARNRNFFGLSLVYGVPEGSIQAPVRGLAR